MEDYLESAIIDFGVGEEGQFAGAVYPSWYNIIPTLSRHVLLVNVNTIGYSCCSSSSNKMLAPFPIGLRATTNPRPPPTMHHPHIPSPALSNSSTDSDDSLSLLSIADLPPFSDKPSYYNYEQAAPPRPPRNPERRKECVPFIHRRLEPAPSPYPPPSAPLPPPPSTPPLSLDLPAKQYHNPSHTLTHTYSLPESQPPAPNQLSLTPSLYSTPASSSQPLPSPPTTPPPSRSRSTTHPQPIPRPKVHFTRDSLPHTLGHTQIYQHSNNANTMYPTPGGLSPWSARPGPPTHHHLTETDSRHRSSRSSTVSTNIAPQIFHSSEASTHLAPRGPVGVPVWRAPPGSLVSRSAAARTQSHPISTSPRSLFTIMADSDSDDAPPTRDNHTSPPSNAALVLNVHGGLDTSSRLHHCFRRGEVPYPRSYERGILDLDILDMLLTRQMSGGSLTWHVFPPSWNIPVQGPLKKILDIGCGNGAWVIEAAKYWKGCQVVGLDVVSLHPNLMHVSRDKDVARRVSWVQGNFLEGLPFRDDEFDFVHVKRIARGVPEDKWSHLFEEILRVMKPGAAFEVVEEDLTFPGLSEHEGSESNGNQSVRSSDFDSRSSMSHSAISISARPKPDSRPSAKSDSSSKPSITIDVQPSSSTSSYDAIEHPSTSRYTPDDTPVLTSSPTDISRSNSLQQSTPKAVDPKRPTTSTSLTSINSISPSKPSTPPLKINQPRTRTKASANLAVLLEPTTNSFFMPQSPSKTPSVDRGGRWRGRPKASLGLFGRNQKASISEQDEVIVVSADGAAAGPLPQESVDESGLPEGIPLQANGNSPPKTNGIPPLPPPKESRNLEIPPDPRDHSILETIYNEMHAERFVNLSPLSLLANEVVSWFENVRMHPPIVFRFPPPSQETLSPCDIHSLHTSTGSTKTERANANPNSNPIISLDGLCNGASPYASLDASTQTGTQARARLPNPALDIDLRSLNLHLALRVKEIVACAEAMWEWVCEFQMRESHTGKDYGVYAFILGLTRAQFDELVLRFELDMREHMGLGSVLEDRFNWTVIPGPTPQEKRFFDTACEKWDAYRRVADGSASTVPHPATRLSRSLGVFIAWKPTVPRA